MRTSSTWGLLLASSVVALGCGAPGASDGGAGGGSGGSATGGGTIGTGGGSATGGGTATGGGQGTDGGFDAGPGIDAGIDGGMNFCGLGEPYLSPQDLAKSPRANKGAEILAMESSGTLVAPDNVYAQVVAELAAIKLAYPWLQNIVAQPSWDSDLIIQFDGGVYTGQALDGGYHDWDCMNSMYGSTTVVPLFSNFVVLSFAPWLNFPQLIPSYESLPGIISAEPNGLSGISSDICLSIEGESHVYIFYKGMGDCPSGCIDREYTGVLAGPDGGASIIGQWNNYTPDAGAKPSWMTTRAAVCQVQGLYL